MRQPCYVVPRPAHARVRSKDFFPVLQGFDTHNYDAEKKMPGVLHPWVLQTIPAGEVMGIAGGAAYSSGLPKGSVWDGITRSFSHRIPACSVS